MRTKMCMYVCVGYRRMNTERSYRASEIKISGILGDIGNKKEKKFGPN